MSTDLVLKRATDHRTGGDFDVFHNDELVGRIMLMSLAERHAWMRSIFYEHRNPGRHTTVGYDCNAFNLSMVIGDELKVRQKCSEAFQAGNDFACIITPASFPFVATNASTSVVNRSLQLSHAIML